MAPQASEGARRAPTLFEYLSFFLYLAILWQIFLLRLALWESSRRSRVRGCDFAVELFFVLTLFGIPRRYCTPGSLRHGKP